MTVRELFTNIFESLTWNVYWTGRWFQDGWCKLIPKNWLNSQATEGQVICPAQTGLGWLDFTIGQALFTVFVIALVVFSIWNSIRNSKKNPFMPDD